MNIGQQWEVKIMALLIDNYLKKKDKIDIERPRELLIDRYTIRERAPVIETKEPKSLLDRIKGIGTGIGKFAAGTGIVAANILTDALDFTADFLSRRIEKQIKKPSIVAGPIVIPVGKETEARKKLADRWKNFYATTGGEVTEKMKSFTENLSKIDFIQPSEEWVKDSTKNKLTKRLPETILNIGPGVVASLGLFAINPTLGFVASSGSVADEVKTIAMENGVSEDKANLLGLATGLLVGWIDKIVPDEVFSPQQKKVFVGGFVKRVLKLGLKEAGTEIVQESVQLLAEATVREDITKDEVVTRNLMAGLGGLLGGVGAQTTVSFVNGIRSGDIGGLEAGDITQVSETEQIVDEAYKQTVKSGGITISLEGKKPTKGVAYSPFKDTEQVVDKANFNEKVVETYIQKNEAKLQEEGNHLGLWEDEGKIYLDISKVGEGPKAFEKAMSAEQLAVFDLESFEEIKLGTIDNKVYNRLYDKAIDHPYFDKGKVTEEGGKRVVEKPQEVSKQVSETLKVVEGKLYDPKKPLYFGGKNIDTAKITEQGLSLTTDAKVARTFSNAKTGRPNIQEVFLNKNAKIINFDDIPKNVLTKIGGLEGRYTQAAQWARDNGFDGINFGGAENEIRIVNSKVISVTQQPVSDIKAKKPKKPKKKVEPKKKVKKKPKVVKVPERQLPVGEGKEKVSRLQARLKGALENTSQEDIEELGLTTFRQMNQDAQIAKAVEYVTNNTEEALKVVRGEIDPPKGILQNSIFAALVELGQVDTDVATQIATLTATRFGQEINILKKIFADNPVVMMQDIVKTRIEAYEKRTGKKSEARVKQETTKITKKAQPTTKEQWNSFIESIRC